MGNVVASIKEHLAEQRLRLQEGTILDAGILAAPAWTKNCRGERDPQMQQPRKGNQWHCGMKLPIGVDVRLLWCIAWQPVPPRSMT